MGLPKDESIDKLEEESKMYGDIVILNITENLNKGKTFEYFKWLAKHREDNYLVKLDDDTFIHLIHYYRDLQDLLRKCAYYSNALGYKRGTYSAGYTPSHDLIIDIVEFDWVSSNVKGNENRVVGDWVCYIAGEKKYFMHYIGFSSWAPIRQNPIHDFDENLDLHLPGETIMIHKIKDIKKWNAIKDMYFEYEKGLPKIRIIRNSTTTDLVTKRKIAIRCWSTHEKKQFWYQALQNTYKN
ncbi:galactosylxylosylprotein 3-beta-galactosyltransferase pvg1 [Gigaspora margarita]|uniref:Hexosyltransferase n=1 Tax=Gigaspora margarita TaxID=4874 RepID=A0A8H3XHU8_GIGMA|nr:galactosylxylosylprotein 3-beta-galactosyltransferase pvg1 [Gigaspora margarita]